MAHDGTTANTLGLRHDTGGLLRGYVRGNNQTLHSYTNNDEQLINQTHVACVGFKQNETYITAGGLTATGAVNGIPLNLDTLRIGSLLNGTSYIQGHIQQVSIGNKYMPPRQVMNNMYQAHDIVVGRRDNPWHQVILCPKKAGMKVANVNFT